MIDKNNSLRIFHLIYSLRTGGAEKVVLSLKNHQIEQGHVSKICLISPNNELDPKNKYDSLLRNSNSRFLPNFLLAYFKLKKLLKDFKPDIIHCHLTPDSALCYLIKNLPVVRSIQNSRSNTNFKTVGMKLLNYIEEKSFFKPNMNLVVCNELVQHSLNLKFQSSLDTHVIKNGVDIIKNNNSKLSSLESALSENNILVVGTLSQLKNRKIAILAFNEILKQNQDCTLWILGDGEERENLILLSKKLGINDKVKFINFFDDISAYLEIATLYWSTSKSEGFSIANLEAMSFGVPAIVTNVDGNKEMIGSWEYCLVDVDDYISLAQKSIELLNDSTKRAQIASEMKSYVLSNFTAEIMATKYLNFYKSIIGNHK